MLYLVCDECGEVFDQIDLAADHEGKAHPNDFVLWKIRPEEEAI